VPEGRFSFYVFVVVDQGAAAVSLSDALSMESEAKAAYAKGVRVEKGFVTRPVVLDVESDVIHYMAAHFQ